MQLSQKRKIFSPFFFFFFLHFPNLDLILNILKKAWASWLMYFWAYGLRKTWLDKCLRSPVLEDPLTSNMVNGPKDCWNLNESTFTIFIYACEGNSRWESLNGLYAKCLDCLLIHWLAITWILFLIETIYSNMFRCNYLKKKIFFSQPFFGSFEI